MSTAADRQRLRRLAAERQRRWRRRLATGDALLAITVPAAELIELLTAAGLLDQRLDHYDRETLARAVEKFLRAAHAA